jgi:predicted transcriptional regulator
VLTLLDRLARRGAVSRRKEGRGFRYQPTVARDKLRRMALRQFLEYHFDGSEAKLKIFLEQPVVEPQLTETSPEAACDTEVLALGVGEPLPGQRE